MVILLLLLEFPPDAAPSYDHDDQEGDHTEDDDQDQLGDSEPTANGAIVLDRGQEDVCWRGRTLLNRTSGGTVGDSTGTPPQGVDLAVSQVARVADPIPNQPLHRLFFGQAESVDLLHGHVQTHHSQDGPDAVLVVVDGHRNSHHSAQAECIIVWLRPDRTVDLHSFRDECIVVPHDGDQGRGGTFVDSEHDAGKGTGQILQDASGSSRSQSVGE